ncbi:MAG: PEP-CTERM sorting domain-containing protein [Verrucomicrobiota bacterium]
MKPKMKAKTISCSRSLSALLRKSWQVVRLIVICGFLTPYPGDAASVVDDFSMGAVSWSVSAANNNTVNGSDQSLFNVIGRRRYTFLRYESGPGSISASVTTSGSLLYSADANTVGDELGLAYGSNIGKSPVPMNLNIASQGALALAIDVQFVSDDIPLTLFYASHAGIPGGAGSSFIRTMLPASNVPYTALFPFSDLQEDVGSGIDFSDLDGITINFGRGLAPVPAGASFRVDAIYFTPVPEPDTLSLLLVCMAVGFLMMNRRKLPRGFGLH